MFSLTSHRFLLSFCRSILYVVSTPFAIYNVIHAWRQHGLIVGVKRQSNVTWLVRISFGDTRNCFHRKVYVQMKSIAQMRMLFHCYPPLGSYLGLSLGPTLPLLLPSYLLPLHLCHHYRRRRR